MTRSNSFSINFEKKGIAAKVKLLVAANPVVIIVTGFKPFGGKPINNSEIVANKVYSQLRDNNIHAELCIVDVIWGEIERTLISQLKKHSEKKIICISFGEGTPNYSLETIGRNARVRIKDNKGHYPGDVIDDDNAIDISNDSSGPDQIECAYNAKHLVDYFNDRGAILEKSEDAGKYICDSAAYKLHSLNRKRKIHLGVFIHVPSYSDKQEIGVQERIKFVAIITDYLVSEALQIND